VPDLATGAQQRNAFSVHLGPRPNPRLVFAFTVKQHSLYLAAHVTFALKTKTYIEHSMRLTDRETKATTLQGVFTVKSIARAGDRDHHDAHMWSPRGHFGRTARFGTTS
jgi:hypothetical protein